MRNMADLELPISDIFSQRSQRCSERSERCSAAPPRENQYHIGKIKHDYCILPSGARSPDSRLPTPDSRLTTPD